VRHAEAGLEAAALTALLSIRVLLQATKGIPEIRGNSYELFRQLLGFGRLNFWRRNFFLILAHSVYKM